MVYRIRRIRLYREKRRSNIYKQFEGTIRGTDSRRDAIP